MQLDVILRIYTMIWKYIQKWDIPKNNNVDFGDIERARLNSPLITIPGPLITIVGHLITIESRWQVFPVPTQSCGVRLVSGIVG